MRNLLEQQKLTNFLIHLSRLTLLNVILWREKFVEYEKCKASGLSVNLNILFFDFETSSVNNEPMARQIS